MSARSSRSPSKPPSDHTLSRRTTSLDGCARGSLTGTRSSRGSVQKARWQHGFRRKLGMTGAGAAFGSTTVPGTIHLAASGVQGPWFLSLDHVGVIEELNLLAADMAGPGLACYAFDALGGLVDGVLPRIYQLAASLPDAALREFQFEGQGSARRPPRPSRWSSRSSARTYSVGAIDYLAVPLPADRDHRPGPAARLAHRARKECAAAPTLTVSMSITACCSGRVWDAAFDRGLFRDLQRQLPRPAAILSGPKRGGPSRAAGDFRPANPKAQETARLAPRQAVLFSDHK